MFVLVTTPPLDKPGGVAAYFRALRPHLAPEVRYFTVGARSEGESAALAAARLVRDSWRFLRALAAEPCDLVHLNPSLGPKAVVRDGLLLAIAKAFNKPVLVFTHGWDHNFERILKARFLPLFRLAYFRADSFMVLAREFRDRLRDMGYARPVLIQQAPVEDGLLQAAVTRPVRAGFRILFLARAERTKGVFAAVEAYRRLKAAAPSVRLIVAGDGPDLARARALAAGDPDVTFPGYVSGERKHELFREADAYLLPSSSEGLPLSLLEAMAAGLPAVATAVGGIRDFFEDGRMGFLAPAASPEVLAPLLAALIRDEALRSRMGAYNREYARLHFSPARQAGQLEQAYAQLCRR